MKRFAILAALAAVTVVNAQGYNSTSEASSHSSTSSTTESSSESIPIDSRTVDVPDPTSVIPTAITSIDTLTTVCGSVTIFEPGSTYVYALQTGTSGGVRMPSTFTGSSTSSGIGAIKTQMAAMAGVGGLAAALFVL